MSQDNVVIASYARTPMGSFPGQLVRRRARPNSARPQSGARSSGRACRPDDVDRIYMGCVLPGGLGQAPARQAAIGAGLGKHVEATTVNKVCGSGMQAAMMAADAHRGRQRRRGDRGRHGEHDQRAVSV